MCHVRPSSANAAAVASYSDLGFGPVHLAHGLLQEVGLELADLLAVCVHLLLGTVPILVDLLDDDFGVAIRK